jgi:hypothetical protein
MESVEGDIYRLPSELRLKDFRSLQKFETYLDAVSNRSEDEKSKLALPTSFLTTAQVAQKTPELVQKRYTLEMTQVNKKNLEGNVGIKDSWTWEVSDKGWEQLKKQFPELAVKKGNTREERFTALDSLDDKTRNRVDAFARTAVVDEHPEWLVKALIDAPVMNVTVGLSEKGVNPLFVGLENGKTLMQLLDAAPLAEENLADVKSSAKEAAAKLTNYSANNVIYYNIKVISRGSQPEILTFAEADRDGVLDNLLDKQLEATYFKIRESDATSFKKGDSWKALEDVKDAVATRHFSKVLDAIQSSYKAANPEATSKMIPDFAATLRFYPYVNALKSKLQNNPSDIPVLTKEASASKTEGKAPSLADQWKLERSPYQTSRSKGDPVLDHLYVFNLAAGDWTKVNTPANGDLNFFHVVKKGNAAAEVAVTESVSQARRLLGDDAQQKLMYHLLQDIKAKGAISLDYLKQVAEIDQMNNEELQYE